MKKLLYSLNRATKHLSVLDTFFRQNYPAYADVSKKLGKLPLYDELRKEIYAGGKKGGKYSYGRHMILGDLLQYILTGRGYYFSVRGDEQRQAFVSTILYVCNLILLMEDTSVDTKLRNEMLDALERRIGPDFFEDDYQKRRYKDLRNYRGKIIPGKYGEGQSYENCFDSMLPKRVGAVPELLVYAYFLRKSLGYLISLLHSQRILGNETFVVPPDYLLLRSKGEIFGIEVGAGKEEQMSSFSLVTSIPVFAVGIGDRNQPQPYRCGRCYKWILYCDEVIRLCSISEEPAEDYIDCSKCSLYEDIDYAKSSCGYMVYHGEAYHKTGRYAGKMKELRYHYNCVKNETQVKGILKETDTPMLTAPIPTVYGLYGLKEELKEEDMFVRGKIEKEDEEETAVNNQS